MLDPIRSQLEATLNASPGGTVRNCLTCAHRHASPTHVMYDRCSLTGYFCAIQRQRPAPPCDIHLSGWTPRPPTGWQLFIRWLCPWLR